MLHWPYAQTWQWQEGQLIITREHSTEGRVVLSEPPSNVQVSRTGTSHYVKNADGSLTVVTSGFAATEWGNTRGVDSSSAKQLSERYTLEDDGQTLALTYTLIDPQFLNSPVELSVRYAKVADYEFAEEPPCDAYTAQRHLEFEPTEG